MLSTLKGSFVAHILLRSQTIVPDFTICNNKFIYYYLLCAKDDLQSLGQGSTFIELSSHNLKDYKSPLPSFPEQQSVANYLDHKTHQVDTLIEKKQKQIDILKEQLAAIINHAVTKGLNPNVKMKDSGIEWLGEIPTHWVIKKIGHCATILRGSGYQNVTKVDEGEDSIKMIRISDFHEFAPIDVENTEIMQNYLVSKNDILFAGTGSVGIIMFVDNSMEGYIHSYNILKIRVNNMNSRFLYYSLDSHNIKEQENILYTGSAQHFLDIESIANLKICYPPKSEQSIIVEYLDKKSYEINTIIQQEQQLITKLLEYRTTLISDAVTGKIDVRDEIPS